MLVWGLSSLTLFSMESLEQDADNNDGGDDDDDDVGGRGRG